VFLVFLESVCSIAKKQTVKVCIVQHSFMYYIHSQKCMGVFLASFVVADFLISLSYFSQQTQPLLSDGLGVFSV
jgi:hypothetical protein